MTLISFIKYSTELFEFSFFIFRAESLSIVKLLQFYRCLVWHICLFYQAGV